MAIKNICKCPEPPGGQAICEPHQMAYCRVSLGVSYKGCIDPPRISNALPQATRKRILNNWALGIITGAERDPEALPSREDLAMLHSGQYTDPEGMFETRFRLPTIDEDPEIGGGSGGGRVTGKGGAQLEVPEVGYEYVPVPEYEKT